MGEYHPDLPLVSTIHDQAGDQRPPWLMLPHVGQGTINELRTHVDKAPQFSDFHCYLAVNEPIKDSYYLGHVLPLAIRTNQLPYLRFRVATAPSHLSEGLSQALAYCVVND